MSEPKHTDRWPTWAARAQEGACTPLCGPNSGRAIAEPTPARGEPQTGAQAGICFRLECIPPTVSHHRKRIVRVGRFSRLADKPELNAAKDMLDSLLLPHQPTQPIAGPVALSLHWEWPWRASESKKRRALGQVPHTSRPDLSNLAKTLEDRLVALRFIEDDNAVVELTLTKAWGDTPGITVALRPVQYGAQL